MFGPRSSPTGGTGRVLDVAEQIGPPPVGHERAGSHAAGSRVKSHVAMVLIDFVHMAVEKEKSSMALYGVEWTTLGGSHRHPDWNYTIRPSPP